VLRKEKRLFGASASSDRRSRVCGAIEYCLESGTPFLGTCGGFQYACIALAVPLAGLDGAAHAASDPKGETLVIVSLACSLYGERRRVEPVPGTRLSHLQVATSAPAEPPVW
jgi:CTP synthase (UTP-ammonia lyase)